MRAFTTFAVVSLLLCVASAQDCAADAIAQTDPNNAVGNAISNAVAQAFTKVIVCEDGAQTNPEDVSSLAISVAVAISQSRVAGEECTANADAAALEVGDSVAGLVGDGLVNGAPGQPQKDLANAWLKKGEDAVADKVYQGELAYQGGARDASGCLDIASILGSAPTAGQVGMLLNGVINNILTAVTCGTNVDTTPTPGGDCKSEGSEFVGDCVDGPPPAETAEKKVTGPVIDG